MIPMLTLETLAPRLRSCPTKDPLRYSANMLPKHLPAAARCLPLSCAPYHPAGVAGETWTLPGKQPSLYFYFANFKVTMNAFRPS